MSDKSSRIYALINSKKPKSKESQSFSFGGFAAVVDEYIEGETVTPHLLKKLNANDTLVIENVSFLGTIVLKALAEGKSKSSIARQLQISARSVYNISKLGV